MRTLFALLLLAVAAPAGAAPELSVVAVPGSGQTGLWATRVVVNAPGVGLNLFNGDVAFHAIRSDATGPDTNTWCGPTWPGGPRRFALGSCPLFWSGLAVPLGGTRPVEGTGALLPGRAYGFSCEVFESMTGVVLT